MIRRKHWDRKELGNDLGCLRNVGCLTQEGGRQRETEGWPVMSEKPVVLRRAEHSFSWKRSNIEQSDSRDTRRDHF